MIAYLDVLDLQTQKIVHTVEVKDATDQKVERVMAGMLINMNTDRYCVLERIRRRNKKED